MEINRQSWHARIYRAGPVDESAPALCGYLFGIAMTIAVPLLFLLLLVAWGYWLVNGPWWATWAIVGYVGLAAAVGWLFHRCDQSPAFLARVMAWKRRVCPPVTWR